MHYSNTYANPFNWTGSKFRYLKNFLSALPKEDNLKVLDCFLGGGDLISKLPEDWTVKGVDVIRPLIGLHTAIQNREITVEKVLAEFEVRGMSKTNHEAYLKLRQEYNTQPTPEKLYLLMTNSFNNQMRFNNKGEFNMPFGKDRSSFNKSMQSKLANYQRALSTRDVTFECKSYEDEDLNDYDLLLVDPPYLNTVATYNEQGGWDKSKDIKLLEDLKKYNGKFIYFNQLVSKGVDNDHLIKWSKDYKVTTLSDTTENCNYQRKGGLTVEVMITNF